MKRTILYSPKGRKFYAVWDKFDQFVKAQLYNACHSQDIKRSSKAERAKK